MTPPSSTRPSTACRSRAHWKRFPPCARSYNIQGIIIAIPTLKGSRLNHVIDLCVSTHCAVQILSDPQLVGANAPGQGVFRELNTADFLSREEVTLDTAKISGYLTGKTVLVTGGGGSIGSELCRQVMRFHPGKLLIFDIYENCAYELQMELQQKYGRDIPVTVLVGSIRDKKRLDEVFETYHPTVVFHAAAHKHVPLMEVSPAEAVKNNVLGTKNLLVSASEHGVERLGAALHRQSGQPHQRHGLHQAHLRDAHPDLCGQHRHEVRGRPLWQCAGQPWQRHPAV